jgi:hypothetical protein
MPETQPPTNPPSDLLRSMSSGPDAISVAAEIRTNASLDFNPAAAPGYLALAAGFGALVITTVDTSWTNAQQIQQWLIAPPPAGIPGANQESALKDFYASLESGAPPAPFATYVGTYLEEGVSHASYTIVVGLYSPVSVDDYQAAWVAKLTALQANPATAAWGAALLTFFKLTLNQPTTVEKFVALASNVGSLASPGNSVVRLLL